MNQKVIGIIGAGKLGMVIAQLARKAGYDVYIAGSGSADKIKLTVEVLAPGAVAVSTGELLKQVDIILLALPLSTFKEIPVQAMAGKLVIDAMNYWWEIDGVRNSILPDEQSSSEAVQVFFSESEIVKAFSHMSYHDLYDEAKPEGTIGRKGIAIAGNSEPAVIRVATIVNDLGFSPVYIGPLFEGRYLEPGNAAFGANREARELREMIKT